MDPEIDVRLKNIENRLEENHQILTRIRRVQRNGQIFKIFYWTLIVLIAFGAFYYVQPYLEQVVQVYTGVNDGQEQLKSTIPDIGNINSIFDQIKGI